MILTPLIDIDNLYLSIFWTFVVIDDKGGEIVHKDKWKDNTKGREIKIQVIGGELDIRGEIWQRRGIN